MKIGSLYKQIMVVLFFCGMGGLFAGSVLEIMSDFLTRVPGLIVLIPAIIAMKGNIFTTLGSRLGSASHMGMISKEDLFNKELYENVKGSFILAVLMSLIIGLFASISSYILHIAGLVEEPNFYVIIAVSFFATLVTSLLLIAFTTLIVYIAFRKGLDPDNITGPILATLGDFIALLNIFLVTAGIIRLAEFMGVVI